MRTNHVKFFAILFFSFVVFLAVVFNAAPVKVAAYVPDEPAVEYKAKCAMCHTATASKFFDPAKTDEHHVQAILKGQKGEKPPFMPGFEAKGMTAETATALVAYMRTLKPAN